MTRDELIRLLLVERYAHHDPKPDVDTEDDQSRRRKAITDALHGFTYNEATPERKRANKRARHLRRAA